MTATVSNAAKCIGYLVGARVLCHACAEPHATRTALYEVNVYPYRQNCHACGVIMCAGQSTAWCELFTAGSR